MSKRKVFLATTQVESTKTAGEIVSELVANGANKIQTQYDNGKAVGLEFSIDIYGQPFYFRLPVRIDPIFAILQGQRKIRRWDYKEADLEQAERIAWRQMLVWVKAQMAVVQTGMVKVHEAFCPYVCMPDGSTAFEQLESKVFKALPEKSSVVR